MNLVDYIASETDLIDYYDNNIGPLNSKYSDKSWRSVKVVVCPLHNDHDASFGILTDKNNKNIQRYHCFGCGASGNIVTLHQQIQRLTKNRSLTLQEAAEELADMYHISLEGLKDIVKETSIMAERSQRARNIDLLLQNKARPSIRNFQRNFKTILKAKEEGFSNESIIDAYAELIKQYKINTHK